MKKLLIILFTLGNVTVLAGHIVPPTGIVTVKRLSAEGFYTTTYGVSSMKALTNDDGSITLKTPFYSVGGFKSYFKGRVSGRKICKALGLGRNISKKKSLIVGGAGSPWALTAEGRDLICLDCKIKVISNLVCAP